ncbi:hypothetical protein DRQ25_01865, partial [Candidatus Fermentibacteria bacterium]
MGFLLGAMLLLSQQGILDTYSLQMDTILLDSLYSNPYADYHFPALIVTEAGACSCLAGFRGGTSLNLPKKSWKFELFDNTLLNASHILLDAQYRDLTLMRNVLGLYLTERLGRPASMTEHVELYVNDEYYGVYVQVERIDEFFYDRNNLGYGPLFKSVNHLGRFAWQPSDTLGTTGFESKRGSEAYLPLVRQLIDAVNLFTPLSIDQDDYLAYAAVSIAILDGDALSKNYYIHFTPEGKWRFYPWDRDATFGNTWKGEYLPGWTQLKSVYCFERSSLISRLLMQDDCSTQFDDYFLHAGEIMADELPFIIDSIFLDIQASVFADPLKQGTNDEFVEAVAVLRQAVIDRGQFIPGIAGAYTPLHVESMLLSECEFESDDDSVTVTIEFLEPAALANLHYWNDAVEVNSVEMNQDDQFGYVWSQTVNFPAIYENLLFSVGSKAQVGSGRSNSFSFYPLYGPPSSISRRVCAPSARRSSWQLDFTKLEVLSPVRYTLFLWSIPVVNTSDDLQDLSLCGFQTGDPPARVFAGAGTIVIPGDTIYLTNDQAMLELLLPGKTIVGDFVIDSPANTDLLLLDPSWETEMQVTLEEENPFYQSGLALNELMAKNDTTISDNYGEYDDWIEITNTGSNDINLSGYYLTDDAADPFKFAFPDTVIHPGDYFIVWADDD